MSTAKLAVTTVLPAPSGDGGEPFRTFGPQDTVPDWAIPLLGDHCWEGGKAPKSKAAKKSDDDGGQGGDAFPPLPPKGGDGSGGPEWVAYARLEPVAAKLTEAGVEVADDASRAEVIDALAKAGVPTEKSE